MYINRLPGLGTGQIDRPKRQLGSPVNVSPLPEGGNGAAAVALGPGGVPAVAGPPPAQNWTPPPVGPPAGPPPDQQVAPPPSGLQPPAEWSPPGQVVPGQPAKPPPSGDGAPANQLPNGIDPAAYDSMFGEPTQPLDLISDKIPSALSSVNFSRTTKTDMIAGILVLIFLVCLSIFACFHHRRRKTQRTNVAVDPAGIAEVEGGGQFRVKTEVKEVKELGQPEPAYGSFQTHRNGHQKSHPIYSLRNPRPNIQKSGSSSRPGTPTPPRSPALSPAKERYYYRDRNRAKLVKNGGSSGGRE
ncbi:hypothetical protein TWF481_002456 [Arthrobotrys musiformis]|uniref:Uncharacterized protein n=1 Tax=Arthrobotrys musiformis TaxID=47236 RepID=A0AAV9VUB5_9PEZI